MIRLVYLFLFLLSSCQSYQKENKIEGFWDLIKQDEYNQNHYNYLDFYGIIDKHNDNQIQKNHITIKKNIIDFKTGFYTKFKQIKPFAYYEIRNDSIYFLNMDIFFKFVIKNDTMIWQDKYGKKLYFKKNIQKLPIFKPINFKEINVHKYSYKNSRVGVSDTIKIKISNNAKIEFWYFNFPNKTKIYNKSQIEQSYITILKEKITKIINQKSKNEYICKSNCYDCNYFYYEIKIELESENQKPIIFQLIDKCPDIQNNDVFELVLSIDFICKSMFNF